MKNNDNRKTSQSNRKNEASLQEKRLAYNQERQRRLEEREMNSIKNSLRNEVSGRPSVPAGDVTLPGLASKFAAKTVMIFLVIIVIIIAVIGAGLIGVVVGYISTAREVPTSLLTINEQTSYIYNANGQEMAALTGSSNINRELIRYQDVADTFIDDAFIAIEDRTFDTNIGIDPRRIAGAVINIVANVGESAYGGSTITQQTIKMLTGDDEVSYQRKVQEWYRAVRLTEQLPKAQIMGLYLNLVPMGNNYIGVQSAAKAYFGKEASEINLAEAALLAGIPQSPSAYNPRTELGRKNGQRRQRNVLQAMLEVGSITANQFEDALNYELVYSSPDDNISATSVNSYYEEFVIQQVTADLVAAGYPENVAYQMVQNGGLHIHTPIDTELQDYLDELFMDPNTFQLNQDVYANAPEVPQSGIVVLDNRNNTIVAMQGGFGEKRANLVLNRATDIERQPGSVMKPLAVYAPALDLDLISPSTVIKDEPVYLDIHNPDNLWPQNVYLDFYGDMTAREAIKISNNVPAVKILHEVGIDTAKNYLYELGIDLTNDPVGLALATGATSYGASPLQIANAFMTFPNGGLYSEAKAYTRVMDSNGNVLLENNPNYQQVFSAEAAYMVQRMMESAFYSQTNNSGYNGTLNYLDRITNENGDEIATSGKSGTTDDYIDAWNVHQTPYYTSAAWFGFDNRIKQTSINGYLEVQKIHYMSNNVMKFAHRDLEAADWVQPAGIVELEVNMTTGLLAEDGQSSYTEYFKAGSPITPSRTPRENGDRNYLSTDDIPGYYRNYAENNGYR